MVCRKYRSTHMHICACRDPFIYKYILYIHIYVIYVHIFESAFARNKLKSRQKSAMCPASVNGFSGMISYFSEEITDDY